MSVTRFYTTISFVTSCQIFSTRRTCQRYRRSGMRMDRTKMFPRMLHPAEGINGVVCDVAPAERRRDDLAHDATGFERPGTRSSPAATMKIADRRTWTRCYCNKRLGAGRGTARFRVTKTNLQRGNRNAGDRCYCNWATNLLLERSIVDL